MSMYHATSFNVSLNLTFSTIDPNREAPTRFRIFASVAIAFAAVVVLISSATILYLCRDRYRHGRQSMYQSPEARGGEPVVGMRVGGSDYFSGYEYCNEKGWTTSESARNDPYTPAIQQSTLGDAMPSELFAGEWRANSYRPESEGHTVIPPYLTTRASIVVLPELRAVERMESGMASINSTLNGVLEGTTLDCGHRVPQTYPYSLIAELESSTHQSGVPIEPFQSGNAQFDISTTRPLSQGIESPAAKEWHTLRSNSSNSRHSNTTDLRGGAPPFDLNHRLLREGEYAGTPWPNLPRPRLAAAVPVFPPLYTSSTPSRFGSMEHESSSLLQSQSPQRVPSIAAAENYVGQDVHYTTHRTSSSASRLPLSMDLPEVIPQSNIDLTERPSLDTSPTSAALSEPITEHSSCSLSPFTNTNAPMTTITSPLNIYSPLFQTDGTYCQPQLDNDINDIAKNLGLNSMTELDQAKEYLSRSQMPDQYLPPPPPPLQRALPVPDYTSRSAICLEPGCGTRFRGKSAASNLNRHRLEQHIDGPRKFRCSVCDEEFTRKTYRNTHEKGCHQGLVT